MEEAGLARGHDMSLLDLLKCSVRVCPDDPRVYYDGKEVLEDFDVIIPRINPGFTEYGLTVLRQFQAMGIYTTDTAYSLELGRDKLRCLQYLMRKGIPFPTTGFAYAKEDFSNIINTVGGVPLVIKLNQGEEGIGVFLAEEEKQAKNILKSFRQLDAQLIVQRFVAESAGSDLRCFVVGGKVVASMRRESQDGDFRANVSLGGHSFKVDLSEDEENLAIKAADAIGIKIAGIDMIRSKEGPVIIEINVSPDFSGKFGLEETSGVDVADAIIAYAEQGKKGHDRGEGVWLQPKTAGQR